MTTLESQLTLPTRDDLEKVILAAIEIAKKAGDKAASQPTSERIADSLTKYSTQIQNTVDAFLKNKGAVTQEQLNQLDEQVRLTKLKMLQVDSKNTLIKYGIYIGLAVFAFGTLWILTKEKK